MAVRLLNKIFGTRNQRLLSKMGGIVKKINSLEPSMQALSDQALQGMTETFKARYQAGESLDDLLPEAFAVVREAGVRRLGMRHFDVQLMGGMVLHGGKIAEMRTGEGKTLVATLAAYLNAIAGRGVHVITVNDYLAKRDAKWMGAIYTFLGLTVGVNVPGLDAQAKREAYAADITYGTNNEFGFDYLRDNMAFSLDDKVQRPLSFAIIDEVDSILIDEARTPLIISGLAEGGVALFETINALPPMLKRQADENPSDAEAVEVGDFVVDEKSKQVHLTEQGQERVEHFLHEAGLLAEGGGLFDAVNIDLMYHVNAALRAHYAFHRDVEYVVRDGEVMIVDEHTGRLMVGRRWSDGLHQAVEAKEKVKINEENQTLASITFQNYFRLYHKLSGMTGTADTEAAEFRQIYNLEVVIMPTHKPMQRKDGVDRIYLTQASKYNAIIEEIKERQAKGQPILVGTASIEASELISAALKHAGIQHAVLNAKQHEREAHIVAQAGRPGTVTIATNMAGRGTDIVLGGHLESELEGIDPQDQAAIDAVKKAWQVRHEAVLAAGGLHILGTERHESRRIDNQLRGRSGRQGDPGSSQFYLSLEDNLMRIFASDRAASLMKRFGMKEDEVLEHRMVNRLIENAQRRVEAYNFDIRKQLLQFDDVANEQRREVYASRNEYLKQDDLSEVIVLMLDDVVANLIEDVYAQSQALLDESLDGLAKEFEAVFGHDAMVSSWSRSDGPIDVIRFTDHCQAKAREVWAAKRATFADGACPIEKSLLLQVLDAHWKEHLNAMDHLRQGIGLRSYAQKNPIQEYKQEALLLFINFLARLKREIIMILMHVEVAADGFDALEAQRKKANVVPMDFHHDEVAGFQAEEMPFMASDESAAMAPQTRQQPKVGRNDPCICGSGKKFKQCCGRLA